jgi:hypothetical protein
MLPAWIVLFLHVFSFLVPLIGVRGIYKRAKNEFRQARALTAAAVTIGEWRETEQRHLNDLEYGSPERETAETKLDIEYDRRVSDAGLSNKSYGQLNALLLTEGRSNLLPLAAAVEIAKGDALWVIFGLTLGLAANIVPTIWNIDPLIGSGCAVR